MLGGQNAFRPLHWCSSCTNLSGGVRGGTSARRRGPVPSRLPAGRLVLQEVNGGETAADDITALIERAVATSLLWSLRQSRTRRKSNRPIPVGAMLSHVTTE